MIWWPKKGGGIFFFRRINRWEKKMKRDEIIITKRALFEITKANLSFIKSIIRRHNNKNYRLIVVNRNSTYGIRCSPFCVVFRPVCDNRKALSVKQRWYVPTIFFSTAKPLRCTCTSHTCSENRENEEINIIISENEISHRIIIIINDRLKRMTRSISNLFFSLFLKIMVSSMGAGNCHKIENVNPTIQNSHSQSPSFKPPIYYFVWVI